MFSSLHRSCKTWFCKAEKHFFMFYQVFLTIIAAIYGGRIWYQNARLLLNAIGQPCFLVERVASKVYWQPMPLLLKCFLENVNQKPKKKFHGVFTKPTEILIKVGPLHISPVLPICGRLTHYSNVLCEWGILSSGNVCTIL